MTQIDWNRAGKYFLLLDMLNGFKLGLKYFFAPKVELSARERATFPPFSRRACAEALSQRRGTLHRLQALRGDLPGAGDHHRR